MSPQTLGIIIGGLIPALTFSVTNLAIKGATNLGIGARWDMLLVGLGSASVGLVFPHRPPCRPPSVPAGRPGVLGRVALGLGIGCVLFAMNRFGASLSVLTPLFNVNTLFTVLLALWIFAEWKQVHVPRLLLGSMLIVAGGGFVSRARRV